MVYQKDNGTQCMPCKCILHKMRLGNESYKAPKKCNFEKQTNQTTSPTPPPPEPLPTLLEHRLLNGWTRHIQRGSVYLLSAWRQFHLQPLGRGGTGWSAFISGSLSQVGTNQEKCLAIKCSIESFKYHLMYHKFGLAVENQSSPYAN